LARLFSLDHRVIGLQYALTSLVFLLIGFSLAVLFRWPLGYPVARTDRRAMAW
jgi:cytochrome c oxidase subunit I